MMKRRAAAAIAILAIAAACTGADPEGPSGALASAEGLGPVSGDRLLVLMDDGSVVTTGPDGGEVRSLSRSGGPDVEVRQPVWSPDGHSVAWAELVQEDGGIRSQLVTSDPTGSGRTEYPVDTATFFLQWDPTSSRIAYLGNFQGSIGMGVAERGEDGEPRAITLVRGDPFYLSWSPEGERMLIHVGDQTLGTLDLAGDLEALEDLQEIFQALGDRPAIFQAPVWLPDGRMVYAANVDGEQVLVVRGDGPPKELVSFEGAIEFVVSPDGRQVAYRVSEGALGGVSVVNLRSARSRRVTETPTSAFHWSPDGSRLLLMTQEEGENPQTHRWMIWEGGSTARIGLAFLPSPTFLRDYVPFYGQFAQSMTPWSPDGASFAFPGLIDERAGIWVQDVSSEEPEFVVDGGRVVAWSPAAT